MVSYTLPPLLSTSSEDGEEEFDITISEHKDSSINIIRDCSNDMIRECSNDQERSRSPVTVKSHETIMELSKNQIIKEAAKAKLSSMVS
jgi:DNA-binding FadR family transcriptional regulator